MYSRILIPLDGSRLAERSLPHACEFARIFGASVVLLRVMDPSSMGENQDTLEPFSWQIRKAEASIYLKNAAEKLREQEKVTVETILLEGRTAEKIIDYTQNQDVDLLVISTHGASGLSRWNTSSIFQKVINKIYKHVLIIRAYQGAETDEAAVNQTETAGQNTLMEPSSQSSQMGSSYSNGSVIPNTSADFSENRADAPGLDQSLAVEPGRRLYQRILMPVDTSRRAECALPTATALAEGSGSSLILASVLRKPDLPFPAQQTDEVNQISNRLLQISRDWVGSYLNDMQAHLRIPTEIKIVEDESVQNAIHQVAETENVSMVVFCAHGQTGRPNWPYGSVVQNYIDYGTRPVLIIQDLPLVQVRPTAAESAAEKYGSR